MGKASDNVFPRLLISEGGSTATPAADRVTVYAKADGLLYSKDDAGAETALGGSGVADILDLPTAEMTATKVLAPDGAGGVEFRAEAGGGGSTGARLPVQNKATGAGSNTNSLVVTLGATPTNGNLLIACIDRDATGAINSITQTGVTWSLVKSSGNTTAPVVEIWKGVVGAGAGTQLTIACATTTYMGAHVSEWTGVTGTLQEFAIISGAATVSLAPMRTPIIIPTVSTALAIAACSGTSNSAIFRAAIGMRLFSDLWLTGSTCMAAWDFPGTNPVQAFAYAGGGGANYSGVIVSLT